jgi:peptide deformylase
MIDVMIEEDGVGLAAPQIGLSIQLVVISLSGKRENAEVFVNPELSNFQGSAEIEEGCLSVPGVRASVRRAGICTVDAQDLEGNRFTMDAVDLAAIVLQHETDHLNGVLFIDRLSTISRIACRRGIKQLEADYQE